MSTYEAARDLIKAQNLPWYKDYLHPSLEDYFKPSMTRHGTYPVGLRALCSSLDCSSARRFTATYRYSSPLSASAMRTRCDDDVCGSRHRGRAADV